VKTFTDYLEDAVRCRRQVVGERQRRRQLAHRRRRSDDGDGPTSAAPGPSGDGLTPPPVDLDFSY
jgi:hypothetical protein